MNWSNFGRIIDWIVFPLVLFVNGYVVYDSVANWCTSGGNIFFLTDVILGIIALFNLVFAIVFMVMNDRESYHLVVTLTLIISFLSG